jgi:hypothetical protein
MSAAAAVGAVAVDAPVVARLAGGESRRLLRHPVMVLGFGLWVAFGTHAFFHEIKVVQASEMVDGMLSFFPGVPAVLAAHMVATRDRRAGTLDLLATTPARAEERVRALCLAALAPALLALVLNTALFALLLRNGEFAVTPPVWHVVQAPLTVLGACLLGTMVGVWAPSPVAPVLTIISMVGLHFAVAEKVRAQLFAPLVYWANWGAFDGSVWVGWFPGHPGWHVVYVLGLCGMAAAAALVRVAERRAPAVLLGVSSVTLAVVSGLAQLP